MFDKFFNMDKSLTTEERQVIVDQIIEHLYLKELRKKKLEQIWQTQSGVGNRKVNVYKTK